ncbi:MAG: hypothetical protein KDJ36_10040 [Hyphomicrobiaceae bacterium]|nr:hypothetical protein [Hyphomicrobiaceae bacterium]
MTSPPTAVDSSHSSDRPPVGDAARQRIGLEEFLARLPAGEAAELRVEAARIDGFERYALPVRGIEQRLWRPFLATSVMFACGLILFVADNRHLTFTFGWLGDVTLIVLLGALPALAAYYAYRIRWRTKADKFAFDINAKHFAPRGAIYFPAAEPDATPVVVIVDAERAYKPTPTKNDKLKPGWIW